ncbi:MAG: TetR/AcrR family transcriptional regulator [Alphaproteobacteria bacterium]
MARKTTEQIEETRSNLIEVARVCFLENGIVESSLEQIATSAGVTRGTIYSQFPGGKSDLFGAVYADLKDKVRIWINQPYDENLSAIENLRNFIDAWLDAIHNRGWLRQELEIAVQALHQGQVLFEHKKSYFPELTQRTENIIIMGQKNGEIIDEIPALEMAVQLSSMFVGLTVIWHHTGWENNNIEIGEKSLDAWLKQIIKNNGAKV